MPPPLPEPLVAPVSVYAQYDTLGQWAMGIGISHVNSILIKILLHGEKAVTDGQTDGQTDRRTSKVRY